MGHPLSGHRRKSLSGLKKNTEIKSNYVEYNANLLKYYSTSSEREKKETSRMLNIIVLSPKHPETDLEDAKKLTTAF